MGIKLDWDLESDDGWGEVEEDAAALHARHLKRQRRIRTVVAIAAVVGLIAAGVALRLKQVRERLAATLEATVAAETLALRLGDRDDFLSFQVETPEWQRAQSRAFDEYREFGSRIETDGEIVDLQVDGDSGRVVLRERLDGEPFVVTWFYAHTDDGWRRVPPSAEVLGAMNTLNLHGFDVAFHDADRAFADALAQQVSTWWQAGCTLTGCDADALERPRIEITTDTSAAAGWDGDTLRVFSQVQSGRTPEGSDQLPAPLTVWLADQMAEGWAYRALGGSEMPSLPPSDAPWFRQELAAWLEHQFNPAAPSSDFLDALVNAYGTQMITDAADGVRRTGRLLPALEATSGVPATELPVDWAGYLANRLRQEAELIAEGDATRAAMLFRDMNQLRTPTAMMDYATEQRADPSSIDVVEIDSYGDLVLATVTFSMPREDGETQSGTLLSYEPFRLRDGVWIHTTLEIEEWQALFGTRSSHYLLTYHELDRFAVEGLLPLMEMTYTRIMDLYGLEADPDARYWIALTPNHERDFYAGVPAVTLQEFDAVLRVPSPRASARAAYVSDQDYVRALTTWELLKAIVGEQVTPMPVDNPFIGAFITWGFNQSGLSQAALPPEIRSEIEDSWTIQVLLDLLVEQHGSEAIPLLMTNLPDSVSTDDWLARSLGIEDGEYVRGLWQDCLDDRLNCPLDY